MKKLQAVSLHMEEMCMCQMCKCAQAVKTSYVLCT
jgi:hypothetical protein